MAEEKSARMKVRLFLSLTATIDNYQTIQDDFSGVIKGHWTPPENLHLTLSFYGNKFTVDEVLARLSSVELLLAPSLLKGMGYFKRRHILYANVDNPALESVYQTLNTLFELPVRHTFVAHVTLMRVKEVLDAEGLERCLERYKEKVIGTLENTPQLMQSELHRDGPRYFLVKRLDHDDL